MKKKKMRYLLKILTAALFVVKNCCNLAIEGASLVAQLVKNLPAMQETLVQFLGWEDSLEEGMSIHSSILPWRIPMVRGAWQAIVYGFTKS